MMRVDVCTLRETLIERITREDEKGRFEIFHRDGTEMIRARDGHTVETRDETFLYVLYPGCHWPTECVHGTFINCVRSILKYGLVAGGPQEGRDRYQATRPHIHFAPTSLNVRGQIPGLSQSATALVKVDFQTAMQDGFKFYYSYNEDILTSGNELGILPMK